MAKFLNSSMTTARLEQLINQTQDQLIIASPYLKFNQRMRDLIQDLEHRNASLVVVYGKSELQLKEEKWLKSLPNVKVLYKENLHAKCYINEKEAIVTSMNLYDFSQVNNIEMGVYMTANDDTQIFDDLLDECERLIRGSKEEYCSESASAKRRKGSTTKNRSSKKSKGKKIDPGYCIRTGIKIDFNLERPLSYKAYKSWSKFGDPDYPEEYCHFSGEPSDGSTSVARPILKKNWKKAQPLMIDDDLPF